MRRTCAVVWLVVACGGGGGGSEPQADAGRDPTNATPIDLYGLQVGARWTFLRSGDVLRWKEIVACEDVLVIDATTFERRTVRAYVRENRSALGLTSVHYLMGDATGVYRVRRDDVDTWRLPMFATYDPPGPRVLAGPYTTGRQWSFDLRTAEWNGWDELARGFTDTSAVDEVTGHEDIDVVAGRFRVVGIERQWAANNAHNVQSFYAPGVGEVMEMTTWPDFPLPRIQIEELIAYTPGYGSCDGSEPLFPAACESPLLECDDAWGAGRPGCTDPRVDARNCGACGVACDSGVCAGGSCLEPVCASPCPGSTICCPYAWAAAPGCTSPARDPSNCGGCGIVCGPGEICDHGECACAPGTAMCGGATCQDVLADPQNCGECGHSCGGETPNCVKGLCVGTCLSVDLVECAGACVDLAWNNLHCGTCGNPCGDGYGTVECRFGECVPCEEAGLTNCGEDCVNLDWSDTHCGACNNACPPEEVCVFGACTPGDGTCGGPCPGGDEICCGGSCIDPRTSDTNCGGCGVATCRGDCTEACRDGACTPVDCGGGDD